jgi:hypothetical protein
MPDVVEVWIQAADLSSRGLGHLTVEEATHEFLSCAEEVLAGDGRPGVVSLRSCSAAARAWSCIVMRTQPAHDPITDSGEAGT